jgi:hypothetical protein
MHTDEYEISLSRELAVCKAAIRSLERALAAFPEGGRREAAAPPSSGTGGPAEPPDQVRWKEQAQALLIWTERKNQYEALLGAMKLSSSS